MTVWKCTKTLAVFLIFKNSYDIKNMKKPRRRGVVMAVEGSLSRRKTVDYVCMKKESVSFPLNTSSICLISNKFIFYIVYHGQQRKNINKKCVLQKNFQNHTDNKFTNSQWNIFSDSDLCLFLNRRRHLYLNIGCYSSIIYLSLRWR